MKTLARVLPIIVGLALLGAGLLIMLNPEAALERMALTPGGLAGLATIRSFVGGSLVGIAVFLISGAIKIHARAMLIAGVFLGIAAIGRLFGLILDGANATVMGPFVIEIVLVGICAFSYITLQKHENIA